MIDDDELLDEFVIESTEHLSSIEEELLELEAGGSEVDDDLVNKLFRAVHSIKGGAGFLGLTAVNQLAHVMENLLDQMRGGEVVPTPANVSALLAGADMLKAMLADPGLRTDEQAVAPLIERLQDPEQGGVPESPNAPPRFTDTDGNAVDVPTTSSSEWVVRPPEHRFVYLMRYDLSDFEERTGTTPIALIDDLSCTGTLISQRFVADNLDLRAELEDNELHLEVLYASEADEKSLTAAVSVPPDWYMPVTPKESGDDPSAAAPTPAAGGSSQHAVEQRSSRMSPLSGGGRGSSSALRIPDGPPGSSGQLEARGSGSSRPLSSQQLAKDPSRQVVRVNLGLLDNLMSLAGELVLVRNRHLQMHEQGHDDAFNRKLIQQLNNVTNEIQDAVMRTRMQQVGTAFAKLPRLVRDLSRKLGKEIELRTYGNEVELDKTILEALADPLTHLIRNACDHGIESGEERTKRGKPTKGRIEVSARHEAGQIVIDIVDDGRGIDVERVKAKALQRGMKKAVELERMNEREAYQLIMMPGFTTAESLSDVSGRGVGMDVVRSSIEALGGSISVESTPGHGCQFRLRLPLTLAIISSLIIKSGEDRYAIPQVNLEEIVSVYREDMAGKVEYANNQCVYRLRDHLLPLVFLDEVFAESEPISEDRLAELAAIRRAGEVPDKLTFVVVKMGEERFGVIVDSVLGSEDIVVKPMHPALKDLRCYSGSTILGDGSVALILDVVGIAGHANVDLAHHVEVESEEQQVATEFAAQLFFTIGGEERFALPLPLIRRIVTFRAKHIEHIGGRPYVQVDGVSTRILHLDRHLGLDWDDSRKRYHLILPRHIKRPVGILVADLIDVGDDYALPDGETFIHRGVIGSSIVAERTTLFLDMFELVEMEEPGWFIEKPKEIMRPETVPDHFGRGRRVLLAEDVGFFRRLVGGYLESAGFEVATVENGREALDYLQLHDIDILVSDIEMPELDGNELIRALRGDERYAKLPAMALSALSKPEDRDSSLEAGYDEYEIKVNRDRMYQALYGLMSREGVA